MVSLALKNLRLRKLRTAISMLAVGVGIMTLVVVRGLTEGTIGEVADRMSSIQADLLVWDQSQNAMMHSQTMSAKYADRIREIDGVKHVVPVLKDLVQLGGQPQTIFAEKGLSFRELPEQPYLKCLILKWHAQALPLKKPPCPNLTLRKWL